MDRLNYFNPYQSKDGYHEDQLTRSYLVLLKHSSHAFFTFMEYCRSKHITLSIEKPITILDFLEQGWEIETQRGNPNINTNYLLSILITDSLVETNEANVESSARNARYDGIITFGNNLTMVIENKPRSNNIWFEQLNPSKQNLAENTIVFSSPAVLEWKEIIKHLNLLLTGKTILGYEKIMIEDFISFVDENFPYLNAYDSFHQCKGNNELLNRRIHNLLKSITIDENNVKYHRGWGFYIETPYESIRKIGLILGQNEKEWWLELSLYFGDTQTQAISFYNKKPSINELINKWDFYPNFHVSFMQTNLVWFNSNDFNTYLNYWNDNVIKIGQQKRSEVSNYLDELVKNGVINLKTDDEKKLNDKFFVTTMQNLNICPGFGFIYNMSSSEAEQCDRKGELKNHLTQKIKECLNIVGIDGNDLLK